MNINKIQIEKECEKDFEEIDHLLIEAFKDDINKYFSPFYSDGSDNKQKGLGLGMYIIKNTIDAQGFVLDYKYIDGNHYFYIKDCIISNIANDE